VIVVEVPGRGTVYYDGADDVTVAVDLDVELALLDAGRRGDRKADELRRTLEADVNRLVPHTPWKRPRLGASDRRNGPIAATRTTAAPP